MTKPLHRRPTEQTTLQEATAAFAGLDEFVDALPTGTDDGGASALAEMRAELDRRMAQYPNNLVVRSTATGLYGAYRFSICQRAIDARLGTQRPIWTDNTSRRRSSGSSD